MALRTLTDVLEDFEQRDSFELYRIACAVRAVEQEWEAAGQARPADMHAEWLAFTFEENCLGKAGFTWGTYYGPESAFPLANGRRIEHPSLDEVTADVVTYWEGRARAARHPVLRTRYADLVWEFGRHLRRGVAPDFPRIAIDATIECANEGRFEHHRPGFTRLRRALELALRLSDRSRATAVAEALVTYEERLLEGGTWGIAFDALLATNRNNVEITPETVDRIIRGLETRLRGVTAAFLTEGNTDTDPFLAEGPALRLASYYRRQQRPDDVRRVLLAYGAVFRAAADQVNPALATAWLEGVFKQYRKLDLRDAAVALTVRLCELGPLVAQQIKDRPRRTMRMREEDVRKVLLAMTEGTLDDVLERIADQFTPNMQEITDELHRTATTDPFDEYATRKITDWAGRNVAEIGSVQDDLDGRAVHQMAETMKGQMWCLRGSVE